MQHTHTVTPVPEEGCYLVRSGHSGEIYVVRLADEYGVLDRCSCLAGQHGRHCSHVRAAIEYRAGKHMEFSSHAPAAPAGCPAPAFHRAGGCGCPQKEGE